MYRECLPWTDLLNITLKYLILKHLTRIKKKKKLKLKLKNIKKRKNQVVNNKKKCISTFYYYDESLRRDSLHWESVPQSNYHLIIKKK